MHYEAHKSIYGYSTRTLTTQIVISPHNMINRMSTIQISNEIPAPVWKIVSELTENQNIGMELNQ